MTLGAALVRTGAGVATLAAVVSISSCLPGPPTIATIQGEDQYSPFASQKVQFEGVVSAVLPQEGFYVESDQPDGDAATSEGLLVLGDSANPGDRVAIEGVVVEVQRNPQELPLTSVSVNPGVGVTVLESGVELPPAVALSVRRLAALTTLPEAIAFWEAVEGMRVHIDSATVVGATNRFGESAVLIGGFEGVSQSVAVASRRGAAVLIEGSRYLPPRILIDDALAKQPGLEVGDRLASFDAIVDYRFGEYRLYPLESLDAAGAEAAEGAEVIVRSNLEPERSTLTAPDQAALTIASINVENLDVGDEPRRFQALANVIVDSLGAPDVIALQEMQDDSGPLDDGVVGSEATHRRLIEAITSAGGPGYSFREVRPVNNQDGGEPWGNIRCSFLFKNNSARQVFVDRVDGDPAITAARIAGRPGALDIIPSPGRIAPQSPAFENSRKPLLGVFDIAGRRLFVVNVHLASKGGDDPAYGMRQPPLRGSEPQRNDQATVVADFVTELLAADNQAAVVVVGDFNDFYFSQALETLEQAGLVNLVRQLPVEDRYSYIFRGQAQALDQILVSPALSTSELDIVHLNSEFPESEQISDHDPLIARLRFADD